MSSNSSMISGSTAICKSKNYAADDADSLAIITQSLEKSRFLGIWITIGDERNTTSNRNSISFTNKVSGLDNGTYRVKTVFKVTAANGETEKITLYSTEKSVIKQDGF